jgi:hypothetical protein
MSMPGSLEQEIEDDDVAERRAKQGRRLFVVGMRSVRDEALAIQEVHREAVRDPLGAFGGRKVLAPMAVNKPRNASNQRSKRLTDRFDCLRSGIGAGPQENSVSHHQKPVHLLRGRDATRPIAIVGLSDECSLVGPSTRSHPAR